MLFGRRKRRSARGSGPVDDEREARARGTLRRQTQQLEDWCHSGQQVSRAWTLWLVADRADQRLRYRALAAALADDERVAGQVERMIGMPDGGESGAHTESRNTEGGTL